LEEELLDGAGGVELGGDGGALAGVGDHFRDEEGFLDGGGGLEGDGVEELEIGGGVGGGGVGIGEGDDADGAMSGAEGGADD
jgi:hypothetical protein